MFVCVRVCVVHAESGWLQFLLLPSTCNCIYEWYIHYLHMYVNAHNAACMYMHKYRMHLHFNSNVYILTCIVHIYMYIIIYTTHGHLYIMYYVASCFFLRFFCCFCFCVNRKFECRCMWPALLLLMLLSCALSFPPTRSFHSRLRAARRRVFCFCFAAKTCQLTAQQ